MGEKMKLNVKECCKLLCVISMVLALSVASCSAADARFEMKNQNGMPFGSDNYENLGYSIPLPLADSIHLTAINPGDNQSFNWTIRNETGPLPVQGYNSTFIYTPLKEDTFNVTLEVTDDSGVSNITKYFSVVDSYAVQANFSSSIDYEGIEANVTIFDLSQTTSPIMGWWWTIDGTPVDDETSPIVTLNLVPKDYVVNLTVVMSDYIDGYYYASSMSKNVSVSQKREDLAGPKAEFAAIPAIGIAPLDVQFIDLSSGITSTVWNFGDSADNFTGISPRHQYVTPGEYQVNLTGYGNYGKMNTSSKIITVLEPTDFASFDFLSIGGAGTQVYRFTDTSKIKPDSWFWNFGDGYVETSGPVVEHTYAKAGPHTVSLTVRSGAVRDTATQSIGLGENEA